nr:olfactory receptor 2L3-like [Cavia porcellus]
MENYTQTSTDFILLSLFPPSRSGFVLFIVIVPIFLMALAGNLAMVLLILLDAHLHTLMYTLLSQLFLVDLMSMAFNHFFCDGPAMLILVCMNTRADEYTMFLGVILFLLLPFTVIMFSCGKVLLADYHVHSRESRKKAYSTCSIHLIVGTFYCAPSIYTQSPSDPSREQGPDYLLHHFTPMFNPVSYSQRKKEVMGALEQVTRGICSVKI